MSEDTCLITRVTVEHEGKTHSFLFNWENPYPIDAACYMFEQGNYSCDCNLSLFLTSYCSTWEYEYEFDCGDTIKVIKLEHFNIMPIT